MLIDKIQHSQNATSYSKQTRSSRLLDEKIIGLFSRESTNNVILQGVERSSYLATFLNAVTKQTGFMPLLTLPMAGFMKQNVKSTVDEFAITQLYSESKRFDEKRSSLPPSGSLLDATEDPENTLNGKTSKSRCSGKVKRSPRQSWPMKKSKSNGFTIWRSQLRKNRAQ